jgi:hypothetical protein
MQLSQLFRQALTESKRQKTWEAAAAEIGIRASAIRGYMYRNSFPDAIAIALARYLGITMSPEELLAYEHTTPRANHRSTSSHLSGLQAAFDITDERWEKLEASMADGTAHLNKLCSAMREGDLRILLSATVNPMEFSDYQGETRTKQVEDAITAIAEGIARGGTFVYIRPEAALLDAYEKLWHFEGRWPGIEECREQIAEFRDAIADYLVKHSGLSHEDAIDRAYRATPHYFATANLPFWMPGIELMMFRAESFAGGEEDRFVIQLPENHWACIYMRKARYLHDRFLRCVRNVLDDYLQKFPAAKDSEDAAMRRDREVAAELRKHLYTC